MKNKNKNRIISSRGSVTVEACVSFMGFLFVIYTILNVVNYCRAQMLISNAVDTTTKELTQYSYFYKMSGLQKFSDRLSDKSKIGSNNLNDVVTTLDSLYTSVNKATGDTQSQMKNVQNAIEEGNFDQNVYKNALQNVKNDGSNIVNSMGAVDTAFNKVMDNPMMYLKSLVAIAGNESLNVMKSHLIAAPLSKAFLVKHFGDTKEEADTMLKKLGVVDGLDGLNFNLSTIFASDSPNEVHIVVLYKLKLLQLFDWAELELPVCKESCAIAWLGGDNVLTKVEAPMIPADNNSAIEENTKEEKQEKEDPEEEKQPEPVDYTNSLWMPDEIEKRANWEYKYDKLADLYESRTNVTFDSSLGVYVDKDVGSKNGVIYTRNYCVDSKGAAGFTADMPGYLREIKETVDSGKSDFEYDGAQYIAVVFVPENIPDAEYEKIKKDADEFIDLIMNSYKKDDGFAHMNLNYRIEKVGGNYDYGAGK